MILDLPQWLSNILGFTGTACCIIAYAYITYEDEPNRYLQHGLNFVGAVLLLISLMVNVNLPSIAMEGLWALVAAWGLAKAFLSRKRA
ncbi:permease [Novosphingobium sp. BL-8H]|uniref:CBU_0592 family membrane protein n=1 Tax=Novosphingobium sp. BL-8H TaxID=3127640 RepID=UPI00375633F8